MVLIISLYRVLLVSIHVATGKNGKNQLMKRKSRVYRGRSSLFLRIAPCTTEKGRGRSTTACSKEAIRCIRLGEEAIRDKAHSNYKVCCSIIVTFSIALLVRNQSNTLWFVYSTFPQVVKMKNSEALLRFLFCSTNRLSEKTNQWGGRRMPLEEGRVSRFIWTSCCTACFFARRIQQRAVVILLPRIRLLRQQEMFQAIFCEGPTTLNKKFY